MRELTQLSMPQAYTALTEYIVQYEQHIMHAQQMPDIAQLHTATRYCFWRLKWAVIGSVADQRSQGGRQGSAR